MKKYFCLMLLALFVCANGFCTTTPRELTSEKVLKKQGYSDETVRLVNMQLTQSQKIKKDSSRNTFWAKVYAYFDPAHDDGTFGTKNVKFSNSWDD